MKRVDAHVVTPKEYDEAPEMTAAEFARAKLHVGGNPIRGRPRAANPKQAVNLRIDPDVLAHFRAQGPGWQTRINDALRRAAKLPKRRAS